jgi:hypothetical protein
MDAFCLTDIMTCQITKASPKPYQSSVPILTSRAPLPPLPRSALSPKVASGTLNGLQFQKQD